MKFKYHLLTPLIIDACTNTPMLTIFSPYSCAISYIYFSLAEHRILVHIDCPCNLIVLFRLLCQLGGGYLFGLPLGFIADSVGATIGATAAFLLGRTVSLERFICTGYMLAAALFLHHTILTWLIIKRKDIWADKFIFVSFLFQLFTDRKNLCYVKA